MILVVSSLYAQHYEDTTQRGWYGVRIMCLGDEFGAIATHEAVTVVI